MPSLILLLFSNPLKECRLGINLPKNIIPNDRNATNVNEYLKYIKKGEIKQMNIPNPKIGEYSLEIFSRLTMESPKVPE